MKRDTVLPQEEGIPVRCRSPSPLPLTPAVQYWAVTTTFGRKNASQEEGIHIEYLQPIRGTTTVIVEHTAIYRNVNSASSIQQKDHNLQKNPV